MSIREFEHSLEMHEFRIPECTRCGQIVWPPSKLCPKCYSITKPRSLQPTGTLMEFTLSHVKDRKGQFGVVDLSGIRIVGLIKAQTPRVGMTLKMASCGLLEDGSPYYEFEPEETRG